MVEQSVINAALKDSLWAALFISLYLYQLKEAKCNHDEAMNREIKLMTFIDEISEQFSTLAKQYERLSEDVRDIKNGINERRGNRKDNLE